MIPKKETVAKTPYYIVILLTLFILAWVNHATSAISKEAGISARFSSTIQLREGKLEISYSSNSAELKLKYYLTGKKPEYDVTFYSEQPLGILVVTEDGKVSYSATPLKLGEKWKPFEGTMDENRYRRRAKLSQKPGWQILVVEKVESFSA